MRYQYFKIRKDRQEWLGIRYFKSDFNELHTIQVCVSAGAEQKRGRGNAIGVYIISKLTLFSNYLAFNYAEPCTQAEYEKHFKKVVQLLK